MKTVSDFMKMILTRIGGDTADAKDAFFTKGSTTTDGRNARQVFWEKISDIGWRKKTKQTWETLDVFATAPLTDAEWTELMAEFERLL